MGSKTNTDSTLRETHNVFICKTYSVPENTLGKEELINFVLWLQRTKKLKDTTIKQKLKLLKIILKSGKSLLDTKAIEDYILTFKSAGYRNALGYAYQDYLRFRGFKYNWKEERYEPPLPFVPLEKDISLS